MGHKNHAKTGAVSSSDCDSTATGSETLDFRESEQKPAAAIFMVDNQTSQRSEGLNNHHAQVTAAGDEPNGSINGGDGTTPNDGYLVDVCFGKELNRFIGKLDGSEISQNSASDNALCTFEEFIREVNEVKPGQKAADGCLEQNNAKQRMRHEQQQMAENKPNGREESFKASRAEEKFFEVALSTGGSGGELIRAHYKTVSEGSHLPAGYNLITYIIYLFLSIRYKKIN